MTLFKEIPQGLKLLFKPYRSVFNKAQYGHFQTLVTGLVVNDKKTLQEINDALSDKNQSSFNRFVTKSEWDLEAVNSIRLRQAKKVSFSSEDGMYIIDDTLLHKTGKKMEKAGYHRSGVTKKIEWGHCLVNSIWADKNKNDSLCPVTGDIYIRKENCDDKKLFRTKREIALNQIGYGLAHGIPLNTVVVDAGFQDSKLYREIRLRGLNVIMGARTTTKISINRKKRISIDDYLNTITDADFNWIIRNGKAYFIHTKKVSVREIGTAKLIVSYKHGDEENIKVYITNMIDKSDEEIIDFLIRRWDVECWHRDAKQHLGLEAYQVRKGRGIQVVVLAILVAYTLLILSQTRGIITRIKTSFKRELETIGEICRFMKCAAQKGWRWITRLFKKPDEFRNFLNKNILVKNAKV